MSLQKAFGELRRSFGELGELGKGLANLPRPSDDRPTYTRAIQRESWATLLKRAMQRRERYGRALAAIVAARRKIRRQAQLNRRVGPVIEAEFIPPRQRPDWPERREALEAEFRRRRRSPARIQRAIAELGAMHPHDLVQRHRTYVRAREEDTELIGRRALAGLMTAEFAALVAAFNRSYARAPTSYAGAREFARTTARFIQERERTYYAALHKGEFPTPRMDAALRSRLERGVRLAAATAKARVRRPEAREPGRASLEVAIALRDLLRHMALCHALQWLRSAQADSPPALHWLQAAAKLPFASQWKLPRARSIGALARNPSTIPSGTRIALEGAIGPVEISHRAGAALSKVTISDPAGHSVVLAAKHRKIDSAGMVEGAYVRVAGEWHRRHPDVGGPALELIRRRYTDLAEESWSDWATMQVRSLYEQSPQGLATEWTWQPGADGAGNQLRYGLVFVPQRLARPKKERG